MKKITKAWIFLGLVSVLSTQTILLRFMTVPKIPLLDGLFTLIATILMVVLYLFDKGDEE